MNGYVIEITEDKAERLSENIENAMRYAGKAMQCVDEMMNGGFSERNDDDWRDEERMGERHYSRYRNMGERRRRDSMGRYY